MKCYFGKRAVGWFSQPRRPRATCATSRVCAWLFVLVAFLVSRDHQHARFPACGSKAPRLLTLAGGLFSVVRLSKISAFLPRWSSISPRWTWKASTWLSRS